MKQYKVKMNVSFEATIFIRANDKLEVKDKAHKVELKPEDLDFEFYRKVTEIEEI